MQSSSSYVPFLLRLVINVTNFFLCFSKCFSVMFRSKDFFLFSHSSLPSIIINFDTKWGRVFILFSTTSLVVMLLQLICNIHRLSTFQMRLLLISSYFNDLVSHWYSIVIYACSWNQILLFRCVFLLTACVCDCMWLFPDLSKKWSPRLSSNSLLISFNISYIIDDYLNYSWTFRSILILYSNYFFSICVNSMRHNGLQSFICESL